MRKSLSSGQPQYLPAYEALLADAEKLMRKEPVSVMMKEKTPASGDKHDYMSLARYYWPDPAKPDGLPYISRDGESNPELEKLDRPKLGEMANAVMDLTLAWYFSGDEKYAHRAVEWLRTWFINEETRKNPNMNYAQMIPGHNGGKGRGIGIIDAYSYTGMLDAVRLLEGSAAYTLQDDTCMKNWFTQFLDWLLTSPLGADESNQKNNHAVAYDEQVILYVYTGNREIALQYLQEFPQKRIYTQIMPDGSQPAELRRTLAFGYSEYNLKHLIEIVLVGQKEGVYLEKAVSEDGRSIFKAFDFLIPYIGKDVTAWPYQQISEWDYKQQELCKDIYMAWLSDPSREDYLEVYQTFTKLTPEDRFNLLFIQPEK